MKTKEERAELERERYFKAMLKSSRRMPWPRKQPEPPEPESPFMFIARDYLKYLNGRRVGVK